MDEVLTPGGRRPYGSGSIARKRNGDGYTYYAVVRRGGKPKWMKAGSQREDAVRLLEEVCAPKAFVLPSRAHEPASSTETAPSARFEDVAQEWLEMLPSRPKLKPSTKADYARIVRNSLCPSFADSDVYKMELADAFVYVEGRMDGTAPYRKGSGTSAQVGLKTAINELMVLSRMMEDFVLGLDPPLLANPFHGAKKRILQVMGGQYEPAPREPLTELDLDRLVGAVTTHHDKTLMKVLADLGLRIGEAFALRWTDWSPRTKTLTVTATWSHAERTAPKSKDGRRRLVVSEELAQMLEEHRARQQKRMKPEDIYLIFPGVRGRHADPGYWRRRVFKPAVISAGLPPETVPHQLRHTRARLWVEEPVQMDEIRRRLGHSAISTSLDLYGRPAGD